MSVSNTMVDADHITNFERSVEELELFWLFCLIVAGKTAKTQARLLDKFLKSLPGTSPFSKIVNAVVARTLDSKLEESRLGQYTRLGAAFRQSVFLDLQTCSVQDLEAIHGVGPKTARLFIMHSRPDQRLAAIDTHILKLLREHGHDVPKATPPAGPRYRELEEQFLALADQSGMSPADYDLAVWRRFSSAPRTKAK